MNGISRAAERAHRARHQRRRADPVDVVIAVHENRLARANRLGEPRHGPRSRSLRKRRSVKLIDLRAQKLLRARGIVVAAREEQAAERERQSERVRE